MKFKTYVDWLAPAGPSGIQPGPSGGAVAFNGATTQSQTGPFADPGNDQPATISPDEAPMMTIDPRLLVPQLPIYSPYFLPTDDQLDEVPEYDIHNTPKDDEPQPATHCDQGSPLSTGRARARSDSTPHPGPAPATAPGSLTSTSKGRKRKISAASTADSTADENTAPANASPQDVKRRRHTSSVGVSAVLNTHTASSAIDPPNASSGTPQGPQLIAVGGSSSTDAESGDIIHVGPGDKYNCATRARFAWVNGGWAQCLYDGPCAEMKNKGHQPLNLKGKPEAYRLYKHHIEHERAEAKEISLGKLTFAEAQLIKTAELQRAVFDNWPKCRLCKCPCQLSGETCTTLHHGKYFARAEARDRHESQGKCAS